LQKTKPRAWQKKRNAGGGGKGVPPGGYHFAAGRLKGKNLEVFPKAAQCGVSARPLNGTHKKRQQTTKEKGDYPSFNSRKRGSSCRRKRGDNVKSSQGGDSASNE